MLSRMHVKASNFILLAAIATLPASGCGDSGQDLVLNFQATFVDFISGLPLPDTQVCLVQSGDDRCVSTDASGTAILPGLPGRAQVAVTIAAAGHTRLLYPLTTGEEDIVFPKAFLVDDSTAAAQLAIIGATIDPDLGHIGFSVKDLTGAAATGLAGVTVSLVPASGQGPYYANAAGLPDVNLTATSSSGNGALGNIAPADYTLTFAGLKDGCETFVGWGDPASSQPVPIQRDTTTWIEIRCR